MNQDQLDHDFRYFHRNPHAGFFKDQEGYFNVFLMRHEPRVIPGWYWWPRSWSGDSMAPQRGPFDSASDAHKDRMALLQRPDLTPQKIMGLWERIRHGLIEGMRNKVKESDEELREMERGSKRQTK
jgi:hypothetical protein